MAFPKVNPPPQPSFSRPRRIRLLGIRHRCLRCFGGGSWPLCPRPGPDRLGLPGVNACWASSAAATQTGSLPIAGAIDAVVRGYEGVSDEESGRGVECTV